MARRIAAVGYYVMLPNLYYRSGVMEMKDLPPLPEAEARARMFGFMGSISIPLVMDDGDALLNFADRDPAASKGKIATLGYCMSGQYAINFAARYPDRVGAAASIYGVQLVTDQADSPHLAAQRPDDSLRLRRTRQQLRAAGDGQALTPAEGLWPGPKSGSPRRPPASPSPARRGLRQAGGGTALGGLFALFARNLTLAAAAPAPAGPSPVPGPWRREAVHALKDGQMPAQELLNAGRHGRDLLEGILRKKFSCVRPRVHSTDW